MIIYILCLMEVKIERCSILYFVSRSLQANCIFVRISIIYKNYIQNIKVYCLYVNRLIFTCKNVFTRPMLPTLSKSTCGIKDPKNS